MNTTLTTFAGGGGYCREGAVGQAVRLAYGTPPTLCVLLCLLLCSVEKPTVLQAAKAAMTAAMAAARDSKAAAQPENRYTKSVQSAKHLNAFVLRMSEADQGAKHLTGALSAARNVQVGSPFPRISPRPKRCARRICRSRPS